ncbi:hypothetical protein CY658_04810 [Variovorax sp. RO1]|uniref:hypothetical protein n=1 Tax=Variovorax sp. RO1 TaxID=2066034 RepID=UPI000C716F65|nr:hypothetical protein [Variovorax sp. RO1]PLC06357.1 hypothetical protein CY658_04810 [Variovorax sp. RO1]
MRGGPFAERLTPGVNVDRIDVAAGMRALVECGYPTTEVERHYAIQHALMRWARGEEEQAVRGAIDRSFYGIDLTSWLRVLACSRAAAEAQATAAETQATAISGQKPAEGEKG